MKTLYLDCGMGAAGDMLTAALLELLPDPDAFVAELNAVGLPHVVYEKTSTQKCGITGTHIAVRVNGVDEFDVMEAHDHPHHDKHVHSHDHEHHHAHSSLHAIEHIVDDPDVSEVVRRYVTKLAIDKYEDEKVFSDRIAFDTFTKQLKAVME